MRSIQKSLIWRQLLFFLGVVLLLGIPYLMLTLRMDIRQLKWFAFVYAWEGGVFGLLCAGVAVYWTRPLIRAATAEAHVQVMALNAAVRAPRQTAWSVFLLVVLAFMIGIAQMLYFADFNWVQSIQALVAGIMISIIYGLASFFNMEKLLEKRLGDLARNHPQVAPPLAQPLFFKILVVSLSTLMVAVLFQAGVYHAQSSEATRQLFVKLARTELTHVAHQLEKLETASWSAAAQQQLTDHNAETGSHIFLIDHQGHTLGNPPPLLSGDSQAIPMLFKHLGAQPAAQGRYVDPQRHWHFDYLPMPNHSVWMVKADSADHQKAPIVSVVIVISLIPVFIVSCLLSYGLARSVSRPLAALTVASERITEGDLTQPLAIVTGDEIGALAHQFSRMQHALRKLSEQADQIAQGDLTTAIEFKGALGEAFNTMRINLTAIIGEVKASVLKLGADCQQILAAAEELASGSSEQAASVGETTATIEELSTTARQIAENADIQSGMAEATQQNAEESTTAMAETAAIMGEINQRTESGLSKILALGEKAQQIGKVLGIINGIAAETKMLSLNAAIEASKAGEAGKGFAVVAKEIRKLADTVVQSTDTIETILTEIQGAANSSVMAAEESVKSVDKGAAQIRRVEAAMGEIVTIAEESTDAAKQVSMATSQQKSASEQVVITMRELSEVARQSATAAGEITQSVNNLNQLSDLLKQTVKQFKVER